MGHVTCYCIRLTGELFVASSDELVIGGFAARQLSKVNPANNSLMPCIRQGRKQRGTCPQNFGWGTPICDVSENLAES
jgi:hypothetical protein